MVTAVWSGMHPESRPPNCCSHLLAMCQLNPNGKYHKVGKSRRSHQCSLMDGFLIKVRLISRVIKFIKTEVECWFPGEGVGGQM